MSEQVAKNDMATPAERSAATSDDVANSNPSSNILTDMTNGVLDKVVEYLPSKDQTKLRMVSNNLRKSVEPSVLETYMKETYGNIRSSVTKEILPNQYTLYSFCLGKKSGVMKQYGSTDACLKAVDKEYPDPKNLKKEHTSTFSMAIKNNDIEMATAVLKRGFDPNLVIRDFAVAGNPKMMKPLLDNGGDPNIILEKKHTLLMLNAANFKPRESTTDRIETAKILLAKGANPALKDWKGNTALQLADRFGFSDMAHLLRFGS